MEVARKAGAKGISLGVQEIKESRRPWRPAKLTVKPATRPNSDINITPLVDVVLVLLIIFMVVTPLLEKDIGVRVPATEQVEQKDRGAARPARRPRRRRGRAHHQQREGAAAPSTSTGCATILARKAASDKLVFMVADEATNYGVLLGVIDGAKQAGAETIGMATQLPAEAASGQPSAPAPAPAPPLAVRAHSSRSGRRAPIPTAQPIE